MGVKHTLLPDGQPPTEAFTVLAQLRDPKANEAEMGAALFTKNDEGRTLNLTDSFLTYHHTAVLDWPNQILA